MQYDRLSVTQLKKIRSALRSLKTKLNKESKELTNYSTNFKKSTKTLENVGLMKLSGFTKEATKQSDWAAGNLWQAVEEIKKEIKNIDKQINN